MARSGKSFERSGKTFKPQPTTLIICEDSKSCKQYLEDAAHAFRSFAKVEVAHCGRTDPLGIVLEAIRQSAFYDHVYCVIDRDSHESFDAAKNQAAVHAAKVSVIDSHPSYEFWLLIHFGYCRKPYRSAGIRSSCERLIADLKKKPGMEAYDKGQSRGLYAKLAHLLPHARIVSVQISAEADADNEANPSTRMHQLMDKLEKLGQLQLK